MTLIVSLPVEVSHGRMAYFKIENMTAFVKSVLPFCLQSSHCGNLFSAGITAEIQRAMRFFFKKWKRSQVQSERCWSEGQSENDELQTSDFRSQVLQIKSLARFVHG